ncbi:MAG: chemotaxis-specific protein-glutamate methyltransferase CheB [Candidatus Caenarcaniphilales bacterium]|jgi:two-component system chemotaxis response regulator CheB|nr:chemotaxis-specific protein-glutamate methyltransferase CheB [Candidatus Caenarcaniphilales bacterium]
MAQQIKLLIVDDSSLVRKILKSIFANDLQVVITDEAEDGLKAMEKLKAKQFDIVLLDYEMPNMNGLQVLKQLKTDPAIPVKPPVLVFSSLTQKGSKETVECLLAGAKDYVPKPSRSLGGDGTLDQIKNLLREKIIQIVDSAKATASAAPISPQKLSSDKTKLKDPGLLVIGSSTGGPAALEEVLRSFPANFPFPILITQHMPENFTTILAQTLSSRCKIAVKEVQGPTTIEKGVAYLAPGGKHMVMRDVNLIDVEISEAVNFCIPSVDVTFKSVAKIYKKGVISVMLTGMGKDGKDGVAALKQSLDCFSIAQDQASSVVWSMPKAVFEAGLSDRLLSLNKIAGCVLDVGCVVAR